MVMLVLASIFVSTARPLVCNASNSVWFYRFIISGLTTSVLFEVLILVDYVLACCMAVCFISASFLNEHNQNSVK